MSRRYFNPHALRNARTDALLTQEELAYQLGVTSRSIARWESGDVVPAFRHVRRLAAHFDQSPGFFYSDHEVAA